MSLAIVIASTPEIVSYVLFFIAIGLVLGLRGREIIDRGADWLDRPDEEFWGIPVAQEYVTDDCVHPRPRPYNYVTDGGDE